MSININALAIMRGAYQTLKDGVILWRGIEL